MSEPAENHDASQQTRPEQHDEQPRGALWQRLVVGCLALVIWLISILPTWLAYLLGDLIAVPWFLYWSVRDPRGKRSSGYWRNTRIAFRDGAQLGATRPKHHLWQESRHIGWLVNDSCRMLRMSKDNIK